VPKGTDKTWVEKLYDKENLDLGSCLQRRGGMRRKEEEVNGKRVIGMGRGRE
jgi:hypothetical protein